VRRRLQASGDADVDAISLLRVYKSLEEFGYVAGGPGDEPAAREVARVAGGEAPAAGRGADGAELWPWALRGLYHPSAPGTHQGRAAAQRGRGRDRRPLDGDPFPGAGGPDAPPPPPADPRPRCAATGVDVGPGGAPRFEHRDLGPAVPISGPAFWAGLLPPGTVSRDWKRVPAPHGAPADREVAALVGGDPRAADRGRGGAVGQTAAREGDWTPEDVLSLLEAVERALGTAPGGAEGGAGGDPLEISWVDVAKAVGRSKSAVECLRKFLQASIGRKKVGGGVRDGRVPALGPAALLAPARDSNESPNHDPRPTPPLPSQLPCEELAQDELASTLGTGWKTLLTAKQKVGPPSGSLVPPELDLLPFGAAPNPLGSLLAVLGTFVHPAVAAAAAQAALAFLDEWAADQPLLIPSPSAEGGAAGAVPVQADAKHLPVPLAAQRRALPVALVAAAERARLLAVRATPEVARFLLDACDAKSRTIAARLATLESRAAAPPGSGQVPPSQAPGGGLTAAGTLRFGVDQAMAAVVRELRETTAMLEEHERSLGGKAAAGRARLAEIKAETTRLALAALDGKGVGVGAVGEEGK